MKLWTFMDFVKEVSGESVIGAWLDTIGPQAAEDFKARLAYMAIIPEHRWTPDFFKMLTGFKGLAEIRWKTDRNQYRVLGFFGPGAGRFTMLVGFMKKSDDYTRPARLALNRMKLVRERGCIREHEA